MRNLRISEISLQKISILLAVLFLSSYATAHDDEYDIWCDSMNIRIDSLLEDEMFETSQVGVCIYDLTEGDYIYRYNDTQTMRPASTQKIITAITALKVLGEGHRVYTSACYNGKIKNGRLDGDLYFRGSFDPLLSRSSVDELARGIKEFGIDTISGRIVIDKSMKDNVELGEGWCWDDDNPQLSALTVDGKDNFYLSACEALEDIGITLYADAAIGRCPADARTIYRVYHTIGNILPEMMKESNNFFAEAVFYNIAASSGKAWATSRDAARITDKLARHLGHDKSEYRIADGSGLSLYNYTTPKIETDFLRYAYSKRNIYTALYASLPIAGVDGTLKRRMRSFKNTVGNVRAKTGSVTCISSLAGYCRASNGHDIAFCIINQGIMKTSMARNFQDKVCALLCEGINTKI